MRFHSLIRRIFGLHRHVIIQMFMNDLREESEIFAGTGIETVQLQTRRLTLEKALAEYEKTREQVLNDKVIEIFKSPTQQSNS